MLAPTPTAWLATELAARYEPAADGRWVTLPELLGDDAAELRTLHQGFMAFGAPAPAAATYLAGWFGGSLAGAIGYALAVARAGFLADERGVRWHLHPGGWPDALELGEPRTVVPRWHAWADQAGVDVVDPDACVRQAVAALVVHVQPLVDRCHGLAKVGRTGLWNEVGDGLGMALAHQCQTEATPEHLAVLDEAVRLPGLPWRVRPRLSWANASFGPVHVAQKGGCCLAYTAGRNAEYCGTCSLRSPADADARQVAWHEERHRHQASAG